MLVAWSTTHPLDIWENLVPEETPDFDHAADELVVIDPRKFCIEGDHSRRDQCRCIVFQCPQSFARGSRDHTLNMPLDESVEVLAEDENAIRFIIRRRKNLRSLTQESAKVRR